MADRRLLGLVVTAMACVDEPVAAPSLAHHQEATTTVCVPPPPAVDVLLVIDDSASMADHLPALATALARWGELYDSPERQIDYRIAVTTTHVAQPWCDGEADDGAFVTTPCRARLSDFDVDPDAAVDESWPGTSGDPRAVCNDACPLDTLTLRPTESDAGGERRARPWLERHELQSNLPPGTSLPDALACLGLVGVSGCAYESPLEAARRALLRALDPNDPAYGFLRPHAALFVLFVGDETDCSVRPEHAAIFDPEGDRALWPVGASSPSSAICWNAGMRCIGSGHPYEDCTPEAIGPAGSVVGDDASALQPVSRYVELLDAIELDKQHAIASDAQRVFVRVLGGVESDGTDVFADAIDAIEQRGFGIGPGCVVDDARAYPPGRTRAVAEAFAERDTPSAYSLCASSHADVPACVPGQWPPNISSCVHACVADIDPTTDALDVDCVMTQRHVDDGSSRPIPRCIEPAGAGEPRLPDGAESCVRWQTGDELDDLCADQGLEVSFELVRASPIAEGFCLTTTCSVSDQPEIDCPA